MMDKMLKMLNRDLKEVNEQLAQDEIYEQANANQKSFLEGKKTEILINISRVETMLEELEEGAK